MYFKLPSLYIVGGHVARSHCAPMDLATDPIGWQREQVLELKKLAVDMGWQPKTKAYKDQLKWIQKEAASRMTMKKEEKKAWPPIKKWVQGKSGTYGGKGAAKVALLEDLYAGKWVQDASCNSFAEEGRKALRYVNKVAVGGPYLARLVDLDGDQKNWRVDTPQFKGEESEEESEDEDKDKQAEDAPAPSPAPAAAKPGAKPAAKKAAKKAAEVAEEPSGKRRRK